MIPIVAERLVDSVDPARRLHACSTSRAAPATRRSPPRQQRLPRDLHRLRARLARAGPEPAAAEGLGVAFEEGDAEALPVADGAYDVVLSTFGAMFAPDQGRRGGSCCAPAGPAAHRVASWTPEGWIGEVFRAPAATSAPAGLRRRRAGARSPACGSSSATASRRCRRRPGRTSSGASPRRSSTSTSSARTTAQRSRPSPRSGPTAPTRSSATSWRSSSAPPSGAATRSRSRPSTSRWSPSGPEPQAALSHLRKPRPRRGFRG